MYYQLGDITFEGAYGPISISSQHSGRYADLPLVNGGSQLQKTGDALVTVNFDILLHFTFADVAEAISTFEVYREEGSIVPFTDGTGADYGTYVVSSYNITRKQANPQGETVSANLSVTLTEYIDPDPAATILAQARKNASGLEESGATPSVVEALPPTDTGVVVLSISSASDSALFADQRLDRAIESPSERAGLLTQVADLYKQTQTSLETAAAKITEVQTIQAQAEGLLEAVTSAQTVAAAAEQAAIAGDLTNAKTQSLTTLASIDTASGLAQGLSLNLISRRP